MVCGGGLSGRSVQIGTNLKNAIAFQVSEMATTDWSARLEVQICTF